MTALSNERAADLLCLAAHWIGHLCDGDDPLSYDELLVVIAGAAGLAASNLPVREDRDRVLASILRLAERTAEDARSPAPVAPDVAHPQKTSKSPSL